MVHSDHGDLTLVLVPVSMAPSPDKDFLTLNGVLLLSSMLES